jgi:O-acetyl-ADP-ribose deacetylase (regulator of RNase III)
MTRVFISHNNIDDPFVNKLVTELNQHGIATFVDHVNLKHGQHWPSEVEKELDTCQQMIAVVSDYSKESKNCTDEWNVFIEDRKEIIPVWLSGSKMYFRFRTIHYIDFREGRFDESLPMLIQALTDNKAELVKVPAAEKSTAPARRRSDDAEEQSTVLNARLSLRYPLARLPHKFVGIATGNIAEIVGADVLVNTENDRLLMDRIEGHTISAALNYYSAKWSDTGELLEETIKKDLQAARRHLPEHLPAGTVIPTAATGSLKNIGVRYVIHAVSVRGERIKWVQPATPIQLGRCVTNTLACMDDLNRQFFRATIPLRTVIFPIFAAGEGGLKIEAIAQNLIERAIDYLETHETQIECAYFVAYNAAALEALKGIFDSIPDLNTPVTPPMSR